MFFGAQLESQKLPYHPRPKHGACLSRVGGLPELPLEAGRLVVCMPFHATRALRTAPAGMRLQRRRLHGRRALTQQARAPWPYGGCCSATTDVDDRVRAQHGMQPRFVAAGARGCEVHGQGRRGTLCHSNPLASRRTDFDFAKLWCHIESASARAASQSADAALRSRDQTEAEPAPHTTPQLAAHMFGTWQEAAARDDCADPHLPAQ